MSKKLVFLDLGAGIAVDGDWFCSLKKWCVALDSLAHSNAPLVLLKIHQLMLPEASAKRAVLLRGG